MKKGKRTKKGQNNCRQTRGDLLLDAAFLVLVLDLDVAVVVVAILLVVVVGLSIPMLQFFLSIR